MQAVRVHEYGGPETMRLDELPTPTPGRGEALGKMLGRVRAEGYHQECQPRRRM